MARAGNPTNEADEVGLPATDTVNDGNAIGMTEDLAKEITNVSTRGSATFHAQMVRFGKSEIPTTVTVTIDKRVTTISKKEKVLLKIKHESLPEIILSPERPTFCPIVVTEQDNKEIHFNFKERQERDTAVVLIRHFVDIAKQKPKKSFLSMFSSKSRSRSKKQK